MHTAQVGKQEFAEGRRKRSCILFTVLLAAWFFAEVCSAKAEEEIELYARSAVLMDGSSGRILYAKEAQTPLPMASTTKLMTCIVALEEAEEDMVCTVSGQAAGQPQVKLGMQTGEEFYLKDLLYSLMLESHNDTAVCIAENIAGSVEAFAGKMNAKAEEIGCEDTYYISPNGLDGENEGGVHHTTAADLARVLRYCITQSPKAEAFLEITGTMQYAFTNRSGSCSYSCINHNAFLQMMDGALTGKTGFTAKAGYCYAGAVRRDGRLLIVSLLACGWPGHRSWKWTDMRKLISYGLEQYDVYTLVSGERRIAPVEVRNGVGDCVGLSEERVSCRLLLGEKEKVACETEIPKWLQAPVEEGAAVGTVRYTVGNTVVLTVPVRAAAGVEKINFWHEVRGTFDVLLL